MNSVAPVRRSYPRIESECGFGTCAGHPACGDKQCPEHPCKTGMLGLPVLDTMTDDRFNLHRVDTSQLGRQDSASFGGLEYIPSETAKHIGSVVRQGSALRTAVLFAAALAALACTVYVSTL